MTGDSLDFITHESQSKYLTLLKGRCRTYSQFIENLETGSIADADYADIKALSHTLAGSSKMFGFEKIGDFACQLENCLEQNDFNKDRLVPLSLSLINAAHSALKDFVPALNKSTGFLADDKSVKPVLLVVEDDRTVSSLLQELFSPYAEIIVAENGIQGLKIIEEQKPALVILDNDMPEMTGIELLEELQKKNLDARIIMLTKRHEVDHIVRVVAAGVIDYITKPFSVSFLKDKIQSFLKRLETKILIADDEAPVRELLAYKFRKLGYQVLEADNGEAALKLASLENPQLAILDRMMPGLDGLAVLKMLHVNDETRHIPVLFLTVRGLGKDIVEGFRSGASDYMVKPFKTEEVIARALLLLEKGKSA